MVATNSLKILTCFLILFNQWNFSLNFLTCENSFLVEARVRDNENKAERKQEPKPPQPYPSDSNTPNVYNEGNLVAQLHNEDTIPLIGLGLGNLQHDLIPKIVDAAFSTNIPHPADATDNKNNNLGYLLIDTARASDNEKLIAEELANVKRKNHDRNPKLATTIHIVTKVWYTYLGYERTKLSIQQSMDDILTPFKDMPYVTIKIHMLIHWPRCMEGIEWMKCTEEEDALPANVKELGDDMPHTNPMAYMKSWHAMEDMYKEHYPTLASIGVSNFEENELTLLLQSARIKPHIYQGNLEMVMQVMPILREYKIHSQMYGLFDALTTKRAIPKIDVARRHLMTIAEELSPPTPEGQGKDESNIDTVTHPSSLLISFLLKNSLGIMVRTTSTSNLVQNSPKKVLQVPELTPAQNDQLVHVLDSLQYHWKAEEEGDKFIKSGEKVHITFQNKRDSKNPIKIQFVGSKNEKVDDPQVVADSIETSHSISLESHPGHVFVVHDSVTGEELTQFEVTKEYGRAQWFSVEEL